MKECDVAICGAGIAGIAAAYYLSVEHGLSRIVLIDRLQPMALTTAKSGENFRDYWPQVCMTELASRSLDLMEALAARSDDAFEMRFFGYSFVSESADREIFPSRHLRERRAGLRCSREAAEIRRKHPYLAETIRQVVHVDRAGAIDVHALGSLLLSAARRAGVELVRARVSEIRRSARLDDSEFELLLASDERRRSIRARRLVLAAGPFAGQLAAMLGVDLPVESLLQRKIIIPDPERIVPREMPFTIFADPQTLHWSDEERELFAADPEHRWLLRELPAGLHIKPESHSQIKLGWAYNREPETPRWHADEDLSFPGIVLRGASRFIPALEHYAEQIPTPVVEYAGYYTRTPENWPLIGPLEHDGLFIIGALSGYGTMCACAAGELCAAWMTGSTLPSYARHFSPDRYRDPEILDEIAGLESDGQL